MTSELRAQALIRKANENGYNRGDSIEESIYWFATQQYLEPDFARAYWKINWVHYLQELVLIEDRFKKLTYIESN